MDDVFVSYAREDAPRIAVLVRALEARGLSVFWDREIPPGVTWREYIGNALARARCVVVAWSDHSIRSQFVAEEADDGLRRGVLVPVLLDAVLPPLGFRSLQAADLQGLDDAAAPPAAFESLIASIRGAMAQASPPPPAEPLPRPRGVPGPARSRRILLAGAAVVVLLGIGLAYWRARPTPGPAAPPVAGEAAAARQPADPGTRASVQVVQAWRTDEGGLAVNVRVTQRGAQALLLTSADAFALAGGSSGVVPPTQSQPVFETLQPGEAVQFRLVFAKAGDARELRVSLPGQSSYRLALPALPAGR